MKKEIKNCPFCGTDIAGKFDRVMWFLREERQITPTNVQVHCLYCGARGGSAWSEKEAIEKWNRRART